MDKHDIVLIFTDFYIAKDLTESEFKAVQLFLEFLLANYNENK